jgi:hypothetical protein
MARSYAETTLLNCPNCSQPFGAEIWLTVDTAERPDLVERIREGTIHTLTCAHCEHQAAVDAPLLVHDAGHKRLLFAPSQGTTQEQDRQMASQLASRLAENFLYPRPAYLGQIQAVPLELLGLALEAEDPAALQADLEERMRAAAEAPLMAAVQALMAAGSPAEVMEAARAHPLLLTDEGQALLRQGIANARQLGQEEMARHIEERYEALCQLREEGVTLEQLLAEAIPPELRDILAELGPVSSEAELEEKLRQRPDLRERLEALQQAVPPQHEADLADRLIEWVQTPTWADSRTYLENHPDLLTDEAEQVLVRLREVQDDEGARRTLDEHLALLRRCRAEGIEAAFAERTGGGLPPELRRAVEALGPELGQQLLEILERVSSLEELEAELDKHPQLRQALAGAGGGPGLGDIFLDEERLQ